MTTYATRNEAVQREIVDPIMAGDVEGIDEFDVDAIAVEVLGDYDEGYACKVTPDEFWEVVARHTRDL